MSSVVWNALGEATSITSGGNAIDLTYGSDGALLDTSDSSYGGRYLGPFLKVGGNNRWAARVIVGGHVVAVFNDDGSTVATEYLVDDHLGSTAAVADAQGNLLDRVAYGAWGTFVNPATGTGTVSPTPVAGYTTVTYTGHELLADSGLIEMGARIYDPATGLFMSPDPTVAEPYNTQDLNQFAYVLDNPLSAVDPLGLSEDFTVSCTGAKIHCLSQIVVHGHRVPCPKGWVGSYEPDCYAPVLGLGGNVEGAGWNGNSGINGPRGVFRMKQRQQKQTKSNCSPTNPTAGPSASQLANTGA